jgi:hypothetical protein
METKVLDLREVTAEQAIDALLTLEGLATRAADLCQGDRIIYRQNGVIFDDEVEAVSPGQTDRWVRITMQSGMSWQCSPDNKGQYRVTTTDLEVPS